MSNPSLKPVIYNPSDRELIAVVKKAACQHFEITESQLVNDSNPAVANIRFLCMWLIVENTGLKDYMIASIFNKSRSTVIYGIGVVDIHKKIYRQTIDNLQTVAKIANTFEKKYPWRILPISTTN
jgi:hypothetical protein